MSRCLSNKIFFGYITEYMQYKKTQQAVQRYEICITDANHEYILDEIMHRDHIEY